MKPRFLLNSGAINIDIVNFRQLSGLNFKLDRLILRFDTAWTQ